MKSVYLILLTLLSGLFGNCKGAKKTPADQTPMPLVAIQTHGCRGYCPMYKATFFFDGAVQYEGVRFVEKTGIIKFNLTKTEQVRLDQQLKMTNLWQYQERFPTTIADAPGATLTVYRGEEEKSVHGSVERPKPVLALDQLLRDLIEAHEIPVRKGVNPEAPDPKTRREVIVLLKPEINAGNWAAEIRDIKVQLVRRLGAENMWLLAYDPSQISETDLLARLKKMPTVVEAQTNGDVDERH